MLYVAYVLPFDTNWPLQYISAEMIQMSLPVLVSNKRAFNERGCVFDLIIALIFLMAVPPFALLCRTVEPQHQHHQSQQDQGHGETQQHPLQDARRIIRGYKFTKKKQSVIYSLPYHSKPAVQRDSRV